MEKVGVHRTTADDGVELAGHVYGQGPTIVFVHGALEDGEKLWLELASHLSDRFCCHLIDMRGTGMSDEHSDLSPRRQVHDLAAYVESIGAPVGVIGESGGAIWTLGATARSEAIAAAALYEPVAFEAATQELAQAFEGEVSLMNELAEEGRWVEAAEVFFRGVYSDEEWATVSKEYVKLSGRYVQRQLQEFEQLEESEYSPTDSDELAEINAPLLLLNGTRGPLSEWFEQSVHHIARHVDDTRTRRFDGLGHSGPMVHPELIADELRPFFERTLPRAEAS